MSVDPGALSRWQGNVEADIKSGEKAATNAASELRDIKGLLVSVQIEVATLKTKIAFFGAIGGIVGAGAVSLLLTLLGHK